MKGRLTIKNNQRHKFSNLGEPCTLNYYCQKSRCNSNTRFFLKNADNNIWFDYCNREAVLCKICSHLKKWRYNVSPFWANRKFLSPILTLNTETRNDCEFSDKYVSFNHIFKATACSEWMKKNHIEKIKSRASIRYKLIRAFDFYKFWELFTCYCFSKTCFVLENVARIFRNTNLVTYDSVSLTVRLQISRFS